MTSTTEKKGVTGWHSHSGLSGVDVGIAVGEGVAVGVGAGPSQAITRTIKTDRTPTRFVIPFISSSASVGKVIETQLEFYTHQFGTVKMGLIARAPVDFQKLASRHEAMREGVTVRLPAANTKPGEVRVRANR